jgi:adenylosuccinate synthase
VPATLILGAQWGDEGKGKVVDFLASRATAVVRAQGGNNAGHTVRNELGEFKLHAVPSGIFHRGVRCIMGPGTVIEPGAVEAELAGLQERGVDTSGLLLSDRAHLVMPYHLEQEGLEESLLGARAIGTTRRGIGPAYADKHARFGIRLGDLLEPAWLRERLQIVLAVKNRQLAGYGAAPHDHGALLERCLGWAESLGPRIVDAAALLGEILDRGERVVVEGQLGAMRDLDHGIYPFVTSSAPCAGGLCQGAGVAPTQVDGVLGVVKAYSTCVGAGPMVAELTDEVGERLREAGQEYGASTGRPRRCGWLDLAALRASARLNRYTGLAVTRLDVLDGFPDLRVCTRYRLEGEALDHAPSTAAQERAEPVWEAAPGWGRDITDCRRLEDLPAATRAYLDLIAETMDAPIRIVSVGPGRDETIVVDG